MKIDYLLGSVFTFLLIAALLFGGILWTILITMFFLVFLYALFKISKTLKGDAVLNFFGILYLISAVFDFALLVLADIVYEVPLLLMIAFVVSMGIILKFIQNRWVVTGALIVHTIMVVIFMFFDVKSGEMSFSLLLTILINVGLIIYVNILKEITKERDYPHRP